MAKQNHKQFGQSGEQFARTWLEKQRWEVLEQNWRYSRLGEIDLIAYDPIKLTLHFIEVKTRANAQFSSPVEAIDAKKQAQIIKLAEIYLAQYEEKLPHYQNVSLDAILILIDQGKPQLHWLENAFHS